MAQYCKPRVLDSHCLLVLLQMTSVTTDEEETSVFWKAIEQVYRFGLGAVAGGEPLSG